MKKFCKKHNISTPSLNYLSGLKRFGIKPGLANIKSILKLFGNPHNGLKIIHIAGTNGKGSTAAFISTILEEAGFKVGRYTSPHLTDFAERITINGCPISKEKLNILINRIKPVARKVASFSKSGHPTFFEVVTAAAFIHFFEEKVDWAIMEAGLGGRWDATNAGKSVIAIITNSACDHSDILGGSISSIAREHSGIIKKNGVVLTTSDGAGLKVIEKVSKVKAAKLYRLKHQFLKSNINGQKFNVRGIFHEFKNVNISLLGRCQLSNASLALGAAELLDIKSEDIRNGLKKTRWPGRFEVVRRNPLIILDGAHNQPAARELRQFLREFKKGRLILVVGILKDKDIDGIIREITPSASYVILASPMTRRAAQPGEMRDVAMKYNRSVKLAGSIGLAIEDALTVAKKDDTICITGSLYTVGEAREILEHRNFKKFRCKF